MLIHADEIFPLCIHCSARDLPVFALYVSISLLLGKCFRRHDSSCGCEYRSQPHGTNTSGMCLLQILTCICYMSAWEWRASTYLQSSRLGNWMFDISTINSYSQRLNVCIDMKTVTSWTQLFFSWRVRQLLRSRPTFLERLLVDDGWYSIKGEPSPPHWSSSGWSTVPKLLYHQRQRWCDSGLQQMYIFAGASCSIS